MSEFTQEQLDQAVSEAVAKATEGQITQKDIDDAATKAATEALESAQQRFEDDKKEALAKERSKREDIAARLKEAKKQQVPSALEGLETDVVDSLIEAAKYAKGLSEEKRLSFLENMSSGNFQNMLVQQRDKWQNDIATPKDERIAELETELKSVRAEAIKAKKESPLKDAVIAHCNPDKYAQQDAFRRIFDMFEDNLDDEGSLVPRQTGEHLGIDPQSNKPFTPETAAKYLAKEIQYLAKPSSTQKIEGVSSKPTTQTENVSLQEALKNAKSPEERSQILRDRKKARAAPS